MKTENLTHAEAVQAMMDGYEVIASRDLVYKIDKGKIKLRIWSSGWGDADSFFTPNYTFDIKLKQPEPKKVKKTFYRAAVLHNSCIYETNWYESEEKARGSAIGIVLEIQRREYEVPK